jgi:hypothetical protein
MKLSAQFTSCVPVNTSRPPNVQCLATQRCGASPAWPHNRTPHRLVLLTSAGQSSNHALVEAPVGFKQYLLPVLDKIKRA